ncbi:MAG TPA: hypothetical protein VGO58_16015 [Chitinophagaceae bacterium]|jgi:hypothetical protein|nr:hypothetical protein [Chitinophagaceae bacterium]
MRKTAICLLLAASAVTHVHGQLKIDNAVFFIGTGATVTVQGDVTSNVSIQGTGLLQLKGSSLQNVDMGGNTIPNLELDNAAHATLLNTNTRIGTSFLLTNGKFQTANLNLILSPAAAITNPNASRFIWTNGTGQLIKELTADIPGPGFELPVGENANYRPAYLTTAGSAYAGGANFGVRVIGTADPNKPPSTAAYLNTAWPVTRTGITGGTTTLAGQYIDPTDVNGTEANIFGYYYNATTTDWSSTGETHNAATNRISAPVASNSGTVSGINKFVALGSRAFLQGAYVSTTGLMNDNLRALSLGALPAFFPQTDPYRHATYSAQFPHVNNSVTETIPNSSVIATAPVAANSIVDWVFLELRNTAASPGNVVLQTRSALIQRDGDIVDVDGVSPVTFNNIADGNYILAVRHRNHLGLSIDQTSPRTVNETKSTAFTSNVIDLRMATDAQLFGTTAAYTTTTHPLLGTINMLWGGNVSGNSFSRYQGNNGPGASNLSDRQALLNDLSNNELGVQTGYYRSDLNMNTFGRYQGNNGPGVFNQSDRQFLLGVILANGELIVRTQAIPN